MLSCGLSLWRSAVAGGGTPPDPILAAFANGEQGAYYDFSDLSSMWQDAAGTTPVTANGQTVGLVYDLRKGPPALGPELVVNGDFSSGASGWTLGAGWSVAGGKATANTTLSSDLLSRPYTGQNGRLYRISATIKILATPNANASVALGIGGNGENVTVYTPTGLTSGQTINLVRYARPSVVGFGWAVQVGSNLHYPMNYEITDISVRQVLGNHLAQATNAQRPLIEYSGGIGAIVGDGVAAHMRTGAIDLSHTDKVTVIAALKINGGWSKVLAEIGTAYNVNGDIYLSSELGFKANMGGVSGGFRSRDAILYTPASATVIVEVLYDRADITTPTFYVNGVLSNGTLAASNLTTGNFVATFPLSLLARWTGSAVSHASTAKYFKSLHIDRLLTADERLVIRQKWATELGIVL